MSAFVISCAGGVVVPRHPPRQGSAPFRSFHASRISGCIVCVCDCFPGRGDHRQGVCPDGCEHLVPAHVRGPDVRAVECGYVARMPIRRLSDSYLLLPRCCVVVLPGNSTGTCFVWNIDDDYAEHPTSRQATLYLPQCRHSIRQTAFSADGNTLVYVCDNSTIWRWDLVK